MLPEANTILDTLLSCANRLLPEDTPGADRFTLPRSALLIPSPFIGDSILLTPFIHNLRALMGKDARLDLVASPAIQQFFETCPALDSVLNERAVPNHRQFLQNYDTVFLCRYHYGWAQTAHQARVSQRVGFDLERLGIHRMQHWGQCLTHAIPSTPALDPRHQVEIYLDILRFMGLPIKPQTPTCHLLPSDITRARQLTRALNPGAIKILIQATAKSPGKRWPYWEELLETLTRQYPVNFVAIGATEDRAFYQGWEQRFPLLNLCGKTSLRESIAVMREMDLVITLDTAAAHMAAVAGVPRLIVLYGPTNPAKWRPCVSPDTFLRQVRLSLPCQPCLARTCGHKSCTRMLGVPMVMSAIHQAFLEKPVPRYSPHARRSPA